MVHQFSSEVREVHVYMRRAQQRRRTRRRRIGQRNIAAPCRRDHVVTICLCCNTYICRERSISVTHSRTHTYVRTKVPKPRYIIVVCISQNINQLVVVDKRCRGTRRRAHKCTHARIVVYVYGDTRHILVGWMCQCAVPCARQRVKGELCYYFGRSRNARLRPEVGVRWK